MSRPTQVSMQDVAKAADVSPQTVSRVANGSDAVKPETRQRVEAAMERLGYRPNYAARALKHGRFQDIGVVMFNTATFGNAASLILLWPTRPMTIIQSPSRPCVTVRNARFPPPSITCSVSRWMVSS